MKRWHAVQCKPREDHRAEAHLGNQGFEVFRPLCAVIRRPGGRRREVVESLFPRYLFLRLDDVAENWAPIRSTRGVAGLVRWGECVPVVPADVIEGLRGRADERGVIPLGEQKSGYRPGERLRLTDGPLAGLEGVFCAQRGEDRVVLLMSFMQGTQHVTVPGESVDRA